MLYSCGGRRSLSRFHERVFSTMATSEHGGARNILKRYQENMRSKCKAFNELPFYYLYLFLQYE